MCNKKGIFSRKYSDRGRRGLLNIQTGVVKYSDMGRRGLLNIQTGGGGGC